MHPLVWLGAVEGRPIPAGESTGSLKPAERQAEALGGLRGPVCGMKMAANPGPGWS